MTVNVNVEKKSTNEVCKVCRHNVSDIKGKSQEADSTSFLFQRYMARDISSFSNAHQSSTYVKALLRADLWPILSVLECKNKHTSLHAIKMMISSVPL